MFESFCAKYSHTFDRLPFGIFSVKRLIGWFCLCLLCEMLPALHCHKTVVMKTPMSVSDTEKKFTLGAGAVLHVPRGICLATVFNWLRHRNEAPKSALHFPIFFAFCTSHRQPRNGDTQPDVSVCSRPIVNSY